MADKKAVKVIVVQYNANENHLLLQNLREKYFKNMDCKVLSFYELCSEMNIKYDWTQPKDLINRVIDKLSQMNKQLCGIKIKQPRNLCCHKICYSCSWNRPFL